MTAIEDIIAGEVDAAAAAPIAACAEMLRRHFGPKTAAVIFYGGALRDPTPDTLLDFYVLADDLSVLSHPVARMGAWLLPPNVYFMTVTDGTAMHRCKVAVMTAHDFAKGMTAFAPHVWARFSQAVSVAYVRDGAARMLVIDALSAAVRQTANSVRPLMPPNYTAHELWTRAFTESYAAELRPERTSRAAEIANTPRFDALSVAMVGAECTGSAARTKLTWAVRRPWGKLLNALRLMKAAFTYDGGLDYAVAKIARHSGVTVTVRESDRRVPLLGGIRIFVEAWRRGGVR
jgi:hypothetical protein